MTTSIIISVWIAIGIALVWRTLRELEPSFWRDYALAGILACIFCVVCWPVMVWYGLWYGLRK